MNRVSIVRDFVYTKYANIYNQNIRTVALTHTSAVLNNVTLLSKKRNEDVELAQIAALLHDYSQFYEGALPKMHAQKGSEFAKTYLDSLSLFTSEEIEKIVFCISVHSQKESIHSSFDEVLKDADLLAKYLENPEEELKDYEIKRLEQM